MAMTPDVVVQDLCKSYSSVKKRPGVGGSIRALFSREKTLNDAVKNVSFSIDPGEIVGFLGPNGAGKTTTLKILSGILAPTSGHAEVLGFKPFDRKAEMLRQIALVMGNRQQLWWDLPAWDSFVVLRDLYDVPKKKFDERIEQLVEVLQLQDLLHTQVRKLSLGERMKCEMVAGLIHSPRVVFLDEPTIGLDVVSQKRIRDFLKDLNAREECTVLLTSHYMQDVQELCRRVIVIDMGSLVFSGTLDELMSRFSETRRLRLTFSGAVPDLTGYGVVVVSDELSAVLAVPRAEVASVTASVLRDLTVLDIAVEEVSAEEVVRDLFSAKPALETTNHAESV